MPRARGKRSHEGGESRHHDGTEADEAGFEDGIGGRFVFVALGFEGEVDHHDGVLFDDADQHQDADEAIDVQVFAKEQQGGEGADAGGGQA